MRKAKLFRCGEAQNNSFPIPGSAEVGQAVLFRRTASASRQLLGQKFSVMHKRTASAYPGPCFTNELVSPPAKCSPIPSLEFRAQAGCPLLFRTTDTSAANRDLAVSALRMFGRRRVKPPVTVSPLRSVTFFLWLRSWYNGDSGRFVRGLEANLKTLRTPHSEAPCKSLCAHISMKRCCSCLGMHLQASPESRPTRVSSSQAGTDDKAECTLREKTKEKSRRVDAGHVTNS